MRLDRIKTTSEFYKFADNWYQRTHRLKAVWQDPSKPLGRRIHAHKLWYQMLQRVQILFQYAMRLNQFKPSNKFKPGGTAMVGESNNEIIFKSKSHQFTPPNYLIKGTRLK